MASSSNISKTERIAEIRNELPQRYPESKKDRVDEEEFKKQFKQEQQQEEEKKEKPSAEKESKEVTLGKDLNKGDELDTMG